MANSKTPDKIAVEVENGPQFDHSNEPTLSDANYNFECLTKLVNGTYEDENEKGKLLERLFTVFQIEQLYSVLISKHIDIINLVKEKHPELTNEIETIYASYIMLNKEEKE